MKWRNKFGLREERPLQSSFIHARGKSTIQKMFPSTTENVKTKERTDLTQRHSKAKAFKTF